jgi:hypothetical protein
MEPIMSHYLDAFAAGRARPLRFCFAVGALAALSACADKIDPAPKTAAASATEAVGQGQPSPSVPDGGSAEAARSAEVKSSGRKPVDRYAGAAVEKLTVLGRRTDETHFEAALKFVDTHAKLEHSGQYGRWVDAICPMTVGLPPALDAFVSQRIDGLADLVKAPLDKRAGCRPNVEIVFTNEPQKAMDLIAEKSNGLYLGSYSRSQNSGLAAVTHPIEARYLTETRDPSGERTPDTVGADLGLVHYYTGGTASGALSRLASDAASKQVCIGSRMTQCFSSSYSNVVIVVDGRAVNGLPSAQIADYIAMVVLSHPKSVDACGSYPSILDLFAADCGAKASASLTSSDVAFLQGLYSMDLESFANLQGSSIADKIEADARGK